MCSGFSLLAAAGPFSTSDSLEMTPLDDVITRVKEEQPSILLLVNGSLSLSVFLSPPVLCLLSLDGALHRYQPQPSQSEGI